MHRKPLTINRASGVQSYGSEGVYVTHVYQLAVFPGIKIELFGAEAIS